MVATLLRTANNNKDTIKQLIPFLKLCFAQELDSSKLIIAMEGENTDRTQKERKKKKKKTKDEGTSNPVDVQDNVPI
jgi:hypothetical protein